MCEKTYIKSAIKSAAFSLIAALGVNLGLQPAARAIVGPSDNPQRPLSDQIVLLTNSRGSFCSGVRITSQTVLTAAHCALDGDTIKIIEIDANGKPLFIDVLSVLRHPEFSIDAYRNHRATADIALLRTGRSNSRSAALRLLSSGKIPVVGERLYVAGYGVAVQGDGRSGGKLRGVYLAVTGKPGNLQIRLQDSDTKNSSPGAGACDGDSGAPAFDRNGDLIGIVSWTTAAGNNTGCGGLTGITPVRRYLPWVKQVLSQ